MSSIELIKGVGYQMNPNTSLPHEKIYVMTQSLPSTGRECETFFSIVGEDNWRIYRTKVPKEEIINMEEKLIILSNTPKTTLIWPMDFERKALVGQWLKDVKPLISEKYIDTDSFKEYFL